MGEGSKRRLAGTAVLMVLLVIFLPMILDEEPPSPVSDADLQIPARPVFDEGLDPTLAEPPAETFAVPLPPELPQPDLYREPQRTLEPLGAGMTGSGMADSSRSDATIVREPTPEVVAEPVQKPPTRPAPDTRDPDGDLSSWVVQVSSLRELSRAERLQRELRAVGFPAFIEKAVVNGQTYHRVRIGPEIGRRGIEATAAALRAKTSHKGQIQRYQ